MKCPHCYCNYDDSERECPMCGKRSGLLAPQKAPPAARRAVPARPKSARPAAARTAVPPRTKATYNRSTQESAEAGKKRWNRIIRVIALVILVLQFVPGLLMWLLNTAADSFSFRDDITVFDTPWDEYAPEPDVPTPEAPPSEDYGEEASAGYESMFDYRIRTGTYYAGTPGVYLYLDFNETVYELYTDEETLETGSFFGMYNDPEEDMGYYTDEFPVDIYNSYVVAFVPDEAWLTEGEDEYYVALLYASEGESPLFYLDNALGDTWWLPLEQSVCFAPA